MTTENNLKIFKKRNLNKNKVLNKKGVTLVELLLYMGLLSILLVVLTDILVAALNLGLGAKSYSAVESDGRYIMSRITYDIKRASEILVPENVGDQDSSLELVIFDEISSYELSSGDLLLVNPYGTNNINGSDSIVSDLTFTRVMQGSTATSIKVEFTVTGKAKNNVGQEVQQFESTIAERSY